MKNTTSMNIIDKICEEKGIDEKFLSYGWIRELKKDGKITHIVRNNFDLNPASCTDIVNDKYATYEVLKENNISTLEYNIIFNPKTRQEFSKDIEKEVNKYFKLYNGKVVLKTNNSSEGKGVFLFENETELISKIKELFYEEKENSVNICPFEDIEEEYRAVYLDDEILCLYRKEKAANNWKHNLANGAVPKEVSKLDENKNKILEISMKAAKAVNARFVTIDISKTIDGRLFVMEINGSVCMSKFAENFPNGYEITKNIYEKAIDAMFKYKTII